MHNEIPPSAARNRFIALGLSLALPGLGQFYNGQAIKGFCYFVLIMTFHFCGYAYSMHCSDNHFFAAIMISTLGVLVLYLLTAIEAFRAASKIGLSHIQASYNHWYLYVAVWVMGALIYFQVAQYTRSNFVHFFKVPSVSMEPAILRGDYIVADRSYYRREQPEKGDIIVFINPDDRSKVYLKRISALPGQTARLAGGESIKVPHGHVFVTGDNTGNTVDSRIFGPVPLQDVLGKIRLIYFSKGQDGVRWNRIGKKPL